MTTDYGLDGPAGLSSPYFFLSYARSDPLAGNPQEDPDQLVGRFFADLTEAVRRHASRTAEVVTGFYDQEIPAESNWKQFLSRVLGVAQVFVPLYSPGYLARSWPGRELACFRRRAELAGLANPVRRFVPVLWTPLAGAQDPPGLREALELGGAEPAYAENGLRAMLKIRSYRASYQAVVNLLAEQIVMLAEDAPIERSEVPDIDKVRSEFLPQTRLAFFGIQTIAPTEGTAAPGRDTSGYGADSTQWRPFPEQELSLAEYASQVAERFDFEAQVTGIEKARERRQRRPEILLIDPWFIANDAGRETLGAAVHKLPRWVLPLVVLDRTDDERVRELAAEVYDMLVSAGAVPTDSARRAARGVNSLRDFVAIIPVLVAEAERQYLRYRSGRVRSPEPSQRPVIRWVSRQGGSTAAPDSSGEAPDA
jgi:FxsC-like protein